MKSIIRIALLLLVSGAAFGQHKRIINAEEFEKGIEKDQPLILDVRKPDEYAGGHIKNAVNIDWQNSEEFRSKVEKLDKSKPVYIYCLAGVRSEKAAEWLLRNDFNYVIGLEGGIEAWKKAGKPVDEDKNK